MKYKKSSFLFVILLLIQATTGESAVTNGQVLERQNFTAVVATKNQENKGKVLDYSTETTPINTLVVAAFEGKNEVTVKGNRTVSDTIAKQTDVEASKWKNFDGTEVKAPAHWTIVKDKPIGYVSANRYTLKNTAENAGFLLADESYKGHNDITLENVSIKTISSKHSIFANQQLNSNYRGISDTTITFKGTNYLFTDGSKSPNNTEMNGIEMLKNDPNKYTGKQYSHTYIKSEPGSILNIYTTTGTSKGRGIGITQYRDMSITNTGTKTTTINQTEMDFHGAVNIKVDRGDNKDAENYGVYVGNLPKKYTNSEEPHAESYNRVTFYSDVKIDVQPVLDENGKQKSIGDAFNVDGKNSKIEVKGDGKVQIDGDIHVLNGGKIELNLKNKDSYFHGEAHIGKQLYGGDPDDPNDTPNGQNLFDENRDLTKEADHVETKLNFTMTNGSHWEATNTSKINDFHISDGATVKFGNPKRNINISVENLKGDGGTFNMHGKIADFTSENKGQGIADKLIVRKSSEGDHKIIYKDDGTAPTKGNEYVKLVEYVTKNKDDIKGHFKLINGTTDQGAYEFTLTRPDDSKLVKIEGKDENEVVHDDFYLNPTGRLSTGAQGAVILGDIIYQSNLALTESLHQRLGEVHFNKDLIKQKDIWVKYINGEYSGSRSIKVGQYTNRYQGLKIGHDWVKERGNWINYNGLSFGYISSAAKSQIYPGKIKLNGSELGLYSSWLNKKNDWYFDFFTKAISYGGGYDLLSPSKKSVKSPTIHTFTYILSAETGKRINLSETAKRVIYLQPEAQLAYHATGGYAFKASNGLDIKTEKVTSLIGRIGFRAGLDYFNEKNLHPYVKLMYEREFLGEMQHTFNEVAVERFSNRRNWWVYGFGLSYMNKAKNTQLYFEAQRSSTHNFKQNWQAHLGVRYLF
ncbi:autotransporter outer membrane beta-barrel domain-containing protein [Haemophilus haemolyticus]|uniref:autotransporter outer membrane beta-barrel domain-containing protein n=1 Tax=Haemophilus haemolyticus TaxID=726 RepID=UPI000E5798D1|nr:autotransporter outer membrane beta-barrel domain-containing protein [Haemophilus haemolyticus]